MAALLALGGALGWGVGDFLGGSRSATHGRSHGSRPLAGGRSGGGRSSGWSLRATRSRACPSSSPQRWQASRSRSVLGALYRGLAVGAMGIVAPISAAAPVVPLAVDAARGVVPDPVQWLGVGLVLAGIVTLSREPTRRRTAHRQGRWSRGRRRARVRASSSSGSTRGRTRALPGRSCAARWRR